MSDYINSLSCKKSKYGVKMSAKADKLIEEIRKYTNESGYINLEMKEKKSADQWGKTHYVQVDTWEPKGKEEKKDSDNDLPF